MKSLRKIRHLWIFLSLAPLLLHAGYRSYGNEHLILLRGPGASLYGTAYGLMQQGSENTLINPASLQSSASKPLYLYHSSWFRNEVRAASLAYSFPYREKALGLMLSRVAVSAIPDSRFALLDYGLDGIPGSGDPGEGNGILDENEIIDPTKILYKNIANYSLHLGLPLWERGNFRFGMSLGLLYSDLMLTRGFGMTLDLYAEHRVKNMQSLYAVRNLPSALMIFSNGAAQYYPPKINAAWLFPFELSVFTLSPGISVALSFAEDLDYSLLTFGSFLAVDIQPLLRLQFRDVIALGMSYHVLEGLHAGIEVLLPLLDISYAFRPSVDGDLGSSHLLSLRLSMDIFK